MVHLLVVWVLLDVEVVIVVNLIVGVVFQAIWIEMVFAVVRVLDPVHFLIKVAMVPPVSTMVNHWLEFKVGKGHPGSGPLERLVVMSKRQFVRVMTGDVDFQVMRPVKVTEAVVLVLISVLLTVLVVFERVHGVAKLVVRLLMMSVLLVVLHGVLSSVVGHVLLLKRMGTLKSMAVILLTWPIKNVVPVAILVDWLIVLLVRLVMMHRILSVFVVLLSVGLLLMMLLFLMVGLLVVMVWLLLMVLQLCVTRLLVVERVLVDVLVLSLMSAIVLLEVVVFVMVIDWCGLVMVLEWMADLMMI